MFLASAPEVRIQLPTSETTRRLTPTSPGLSAPAWIVERVSSVGGSVEITLRDTSAALAIKGAGASYADALDNALRLAADSSASR